MVLMFFFFNQTTAYEMRISDWSSYVCSSDLTLSVMYMPWGIAANYARSDSFFEAVYPERAEVSPTGVAAPLVSIAPLMESASRQWHGAAVGNVRIVNP